MTLKTVTVNEIRSWAPCKDPTEYVAEYWTGTALDVLRMESVLDIDKLWVVLRDECLDATTLRLFAVWCAREALKLAKNPDPRSFVACDVAERYAHGEATLEEFRAAADAYAVVAAHAYAAACMAASTYACNAYAAARNAYAARAAYVVANAYVYDAQVQHLIEMIEGNTNA